MEYEEGTEYVLTASRCRPSWKEQVGNGLLTRSKRFKRGEVLKGIPEEQVARLVELGHAVPKDEWDPAEFRKQSAARRQAMMQSAASDMASEVRAASARGNGQPVAGLEDAEPKREVDGIEVEDVDGLDANGKPKQGDDSGDASDEEEQVTDSLDDLPYAELVKKAKAETGNGGGTAEELKARIREHNAQ